LFVFALRHGGLLLDIAKVGMVNNQLLTGNRKYSSILNEWMVVGIGNA